MDTVACVREKTSRKQVNVILPRELYDRLAPAAGMFGSVQRTVATAIAAFLALPEDQQWEWFRRTSQQMYATAESSALGQDVAADADKVLRRAKRRPA